MSFVLFLRGLVVVLVVFAITTYVMTGSLWTTFMQTAICAVLIQIGYFVAVLFLVWRSPKTQVETPKNEASQGLSKEQQPAANVTPLPGTPRSDHP
jgi:exopolysaccharide production repressor protein